MANDPWHPLHCSFQASHGKTVQHNLVRDKLWAFCRLAGFGNAATECKAYNATAHAQPDVVVTFDNDVHVIDVSGIDPCAVSYVSRASKRTRAAASLREQEKNTHYATMVRLHGVKFFPFVFETLGGLGKAAIEFAEKLAYHARAVPGSAAAGSFRHHLLSAISVIVQSCNADLVNFAYVESNDRDTGRPRHTAAATAAARRRPSAPHSRTLPNRAGNPSPAAPSLGHPGAA
jgi:hypothetical protein